MLPKAPIRSPFIYLCVFIIPFRASIVNRDVKKHTVDLQFQSKLSTADMI